MSELTQSLAAAAAFCCLLVTVHTVWHGAASAARGLLAAFFLVFGLQLALLAIAVPTEIEGLMRLRALLALVFIPKGYLLLTVTRRSAARFQSTDIIHVLPLCCGAFAIAAERNDALDLIIPATEFAYAAAAARLIPSELSQFASLEAHQRRALAWLVAITALYLVMGLVDVGILVDLARGMPVVDSYTLAAGIGVAAAFAGYALLGGFAQTAYASVVAGGLAAPRYARSTLHPDERAAIARRLQAMLDDPALLRDEGLTVARLARRMTLPARHLTEAVNVELERSFSDLLNERRVEAAKSLLRSPDYAKTSILEVAHLVGYASKSNFNREFSRRTGTTPSAYRRAVSGGGDGENEDLGRPQS